MQSLKQYVLFALMAVFVASFAIVPAHAQSARISANIPFDFSLGKSNLTAGTYSIETQGALVAFSMRGGDTKYALLRQPSDAVSHDGQPYLIFIRYGTESFLSKVVFSDDQAYDLPLSSREKELATHGMSGEQIAVLIQPAR